MKKLLLLSITFLILFSCEDQVAIDEPVIEEEPGLATVDLGPRFLMDQEFATLYSNTLTELRNKRNSLENSINLKSVQTSGNKLSFPTVSSFRTVFEQVENADEEWQNFLNAKIDFLLSHAVNNAVILQQFSTDEEIEFALEDILEDDGFEDFDIQRNVASRMPVQPLWTTVRSLEEEWLRNAPNDLDLATDPTEEYLDDDLMQLFLNQSSEIVLLGQRRVFEEDEVNQARSADPKDVKERTTTATLDGCVTWKRRTRYGDNGNRRLKVKVKVRNYIVSKSLKAKVVGYARKNGKWKRRRFQKVLNMSGDAVIHYAQGLGCSPFVVANISLLKSGRNRSLSITERRWGLDAYVGACTGRFAAFGDTENLSVAASL